MIERPDDGWSGPLHEALGKDPEVVVLEQPERHAVAAVRGQLLVGAGELQRSPRLASELRELAEQVAEAHPDSDGTDGDDPVGLWRLRTDHDLAEILGRLYGLSDRETRAHVAPNHVLVPCPSPHWCPASAPRPTTEQVEIPPFACDDAVSVVVIDAGYVELPLLTQRGGIEVVHPRSWRSVVGASASTAPSVAAGGSGPLPAIAGHASFIVGQVAARCPNAHIMVVNHEDPWVDEWSVAASLTRYAGAGAESGAADVISCGYAVVTAGARSSFPFANALRRLAPETAVIAPAGNQDSAAPHWPAASKRVVGVGAFDERAGNTRAQFSNHGPWVDCSAGGCDVVSTFVPGDWVTQDGDGTQQSFGPFATWSGTSFSTPRVTAAVAARLSTRRASGAGVSGRLVAAELAAALVPGTVLDTDPDVGTKLMLP